MATPGRLLDFVEKGYVDFRAIRFAVLDEADRMLDMGFQDAVEKIMCHPTMVATGTRQTVNQKKNLFALPLTFQIQNSISLISIS